ncbi:MAG: PSD1 and planctomycete cytochrome C domain-containing protein [Bryobacteraceae bacterium]
MHRGLSLTALVALVALADDREFFETRIRPVLAKNCYTCHTTARMGGLALDARASALKGGNSGPAVLPGDPEKSLLLQAVSHTHAKLKMPPTGKLTEAEIADLRAWVARGALWPEGSTAPIERGFWSLRPVRKPAPPEVRNKTWARTAIDRFILAALESKGLAPVNPAGKRTLIRRVTFDLTGLPPEPAEVDAFLADSAPDAFAKVVDQLLASPHYGERWGRHWLDVARYGDDKLDPTGETAHPNAFRYRDWVIQAFNDDMPYDRFVMAQLAGDLMPDKEKYQAGLALYALSPEFQDDRVDVTTRGFMGFTVACAQCHDHKFDPIPQKDYYSLLGVFRSTELGEIPLAPDEIVKAYRDHKKKIDDEDKAIKDFLQTQAIQLAEIFAAKTARYLRAAEGGPKDGLDPETLDRWIAYLKKTDREHPYLPARDPGEFERFVLSVHADKKAVDDKNHITLGGSKERRDLSSANLVSLERDKYFLWRDLFGDKGVLYYGDGKIDRFLQGEWKTHLDALRARLADLKKTLPPQYPFLQAIRDVKTPRNIRVALRGNPDSPGDEAPRRFLSALCEGEPKPFATGSGRLELAEAIASKQNPLTARVMVNRIWLDHFGQGLVRTPSNFGQLGERPSHPELLDYLAARLVENNWSIKALHREILMSNTYALSSASSERNAAVDADNRLLWRATRRRLDAEALRDSLLWAAGTLDRTAGGEPKRLTDDNRRRAVYGFISRKKLDGMLSLFDFPNPNNTSEQRLTTSVPLQRLFYLNSSFVQTQAQAFAARLQGPDREKIAQAYRLLFSRAPDPAETRAGLDFLRHGDWPRYAQVLLSTSEFSFVN